MALAIGFATLSGTMRRALALLAFAAGCSGGGDDCPPTHFYPVDVAAKCVARVPVDSGCSNAPGPPVTRLDTLSSCP